MTPMIRTAPTLIACLLMGCGDAGEGTAQPAAGPPPQAEPQPSGPVAVTSPGKAPSPSPPSPSPPLPALVEAAALAAILPQALGEYRASGPAEPQSVKLADGNTVSQAKRRYAHGGSTLVLEIMDAVQAGMVLTVVKGAQKKERWTPDHITKGMDINGTWVVTQWSGKQQSARIGALLGERLIYSLSVTPATTVAPAIAMAQLLDYGPALALLPQ